MHAKRGDVGLEKARSCMRVERWKAVLNCVLREERLRGQCSDGGREAEGKELRVPDRPLSFSGRLKYRYRKTSLNASFLF